MSERDLSKQVAAAKSLRAALEGYGDEELTRSMIEGETSLNDAISSVMASVLDDEILVTGLDAMLKTLSSRKSRIEAGIERKRAAVEQAMIIGEVKSLKLPDATLSLRDCQPKVIVVDETKIPERFFKPQPPKLDKTALNEAVKNGEAIEGTVLGNRSVSLSVRRA